LMNEGLKSTVGEVGVNDGEQNSNSSTEMDFMDPRVWSEGESRSNSRTQERRAGSGGGGWLAGGGGFRESLKMPIMWDGG
jgi:hypothetical protein